MTADISVFLPLRAGSARVPRKNTRPFHPDGRSLFQLKLGQLAALAGSFREIVVSTDDEEVFAQFGATDVPDNCRIVARPAELALSTTRLPDLIAHVPLAVEGEWILWTHVTSPFFGEAEMSAVLEQFGKDVSEGPFDSLMSVTELRQFLWSAAEGRVINVDPAVNRWPSTQDLDPLYEINSGVFIADRACYLERGDRIGTNPALFLTEGLARIDVDWPADFAIAQALVPPYEQGLAADG